MLSAQSCARCAPTATSMHWINSAIVGLIKSHRGFDALKRCLGEKRHPLDPGDADVQALLRDDLIVAALPRMTLIDPEIEQVFTAVCRLSILLSATQKAWR